ncbi:MAG: hypothetical protein AB1797_03155 [bacterium]
MPNQIALQLPPEQREMLVEILRKRQIEIRREEIAADARKSIATFREGNLISIPAQTSSKGKTMRNTIYPPGWDEDRVKSLRFPPFGRASRAMLVIAMVTAQN